MTDLMFLDATNFSQEEKDLYWHVIQKNSEPTGINIFEVMDEPYIKTTCNQYIHDERIDLNEKIH